MKSGKFVIILLSFIVLFTSIYAEDYEYQYFADEDSQNERNKYVPFSDWIPKIRKHYYTVPHNLEDYYLLYGMKQHYNENTLRHNIKMLKHALTLRFRHPLDALCAVETEQEYYKYRNLMFMQINLLIMRNYMKIAVRYDKRVIRFYDQDFADELEESLRIAGDLYAEALPYWLEAKRYAKRASKVKRTLDLGTVESTRYSIITGELDYKRIINKHIANTQKKRQKLASMSTAQASN